MRCPFYHPQVPVVLPAVLVGKTCEACGAQATVRTMDIIDGEPIYGTRFIKREAGAHHWYCFDHQPYRPFSMRRWWFVHVDVPITLLWLRMTGQIRALEHKDGSR